MNQTADDMYVLFRNTNEDIAKISQNIGWSVDDITLVKNHLFKNELLLDDGLRVLDSDYEIAVAWQRLIDNKYYTSDILLLKHELYESTYYNFFHQTTNCTQRQAHELTSKFFDWDKLIDELSKN